jgi:beta-lactamase class A
MLVILLAAGGVSVRWAINRTAAEAPCEENYRWVNKNLKCRAPVIDKGLYTELREKLKGKFAVLKEEGKVGDVGVFFRDLENGPTFGINEQMEFVPASLLKMPVMLTYFKLAEDDPELLSRRLRSDSQKPDAFYQGYRPESVVEPDTQYEIDDLIYRMIAYSDNRAYFMLTGYLREISPEDDLILRTYIELGMIIDNNNPEVSDLSTKTYASIFRILYNASYLSKALSDKALGYLSDAYFGNGLRRGIPEDIPVAHKFGERVLSDGSKQLHDCGVIYYPDNPYLLCVMTRGDSMTELSEVVGIVSHEVYREVESRRK